tara:strand:+ start:478 stop:993 length:516 start_codon:yes stop_codon:yes gene_type:complete
MFNIGGSAAQFAIGLTNDTGATRAVGDLVAVKIANLSATLGSGAATGYEADLVKILANGQGDFNRVATGVIVGKPGSEFAVGEEMMVQVYGPAKVKVRLGAGASTTLYRDAVMLNDQVYLTENGARSNYNSAGETLQAFQELRATILQVVTNTTSGAADILCTCYLKWPTI